MSGSSHRWRVARPAVTRSRAYRLTVALLLAILAAGTVAVLVLAAAVLLGVVPYPGR
ncbi:MAG: hypothetical protein QN173_05670 [Armatimonadota bacterium]|nr:hypothetical protein [Armatimonadota bacterium]MDR7402398.1 hypothetical protein [Armatimonadota bacterium]MDR7404084.1 hypothetical protein [Armatimonadota bacterium]MDR7437581.1 hypothetical protein [Armatimonadota bacterium]MDR7472175.1 hypothetical protein [Armatimonadota bacterium]